MRFIEDKTQSEIAAVLAISQMHVSQLLTRTLAQLRDQIEREAEVDGDRSVPEPVGARAS